YCRSLLMMADFVTPRHSAVERLRRRIELFRQHHNGCERRYETATLERLEMERPQTFALHQRCLQTKAKRSSKHRQPPASGEQSAQRAPGGGPEESGGAAAEQSRNSTLIALQETVKRKLESAGSPLGRDPVNGFSDGFPPNKKACLDNGTANGSPLDSKLGIGDSLNSNGTHGPAGESKESGRESGSDFHRKEMKQEPDDILPIMPSGGGSNSLFPDLNEQEWTELMEELNCAVAYEDIQDILNDGFEDRKDPLEMAHTPGAAGAVGGAASGGGQAQALLPPDLNSVKSEFSPASVAFDQDSRTGSPHVRSTSSQLQPPSNQLLPTGPPGPKDLSPAQHLQQLARSGPPPPRPDAAQAAATGAQVIQPAWSQMANASPSPLGGTFGMDKLSSPSLYPQDFSRSAQKQLLMPAQPNKASPKAGAGGYMPGHPGAPGHHSMLGHPPAGPPLNHAPAPGAQAPAAMLNYNNTKPLSHFVPNAQSQNKTALLTLLRQQQQHIPHAQVPRGLLQPGAGPGFCSRSAPPHGPTSTMAPTPVNNAMTVQPGANAMAANHGGAAYLSGQAAALRAGGSVLLKSEIGLSVKASSPSGSFVDGRRRSPDSSQEKQRQQDQQLQRHLTRPPPQYQDQPASQNPFSQPPVNQFTASSQPMGSSQPIGALGGSAPGAQRMFPQNQAMLGMSMSPVLVRRGRGQRGRAASSVQQHESSPRSPRPPVPAGGPPAAAPGRHERPLQTEPAAQPNAAMLKQQQQLAAARMPAAMQSNMGAALPSAMAASMAGPQNSAWPQQMSSQPPSNSATLPPNAFSNPPASFHLQQQQPPRIPKMPPGGAAFGASAAGRPLGGLNPGQQMMQQRAPPCWPEPRPAHHSQSQAVLPDLAAFAQPQGNGRQGLQCNQGYQVSRAAGQQQQVSFGYNAASGSFAGESELVDSLLKGQNTQDWMSALDELLATH
uniref:Mastermind like transcriptional coactivator 1 n=1 Tax=Tetraodon nigroviridis TaxID=99883 RepID=H3D602_TETNG